MREAGSEAFLSRDSQSFLIKFIPSLLVLYLFRWRSEPLKCSDEILLSSILSIFRELRCLLKFYIFNLTIPLSNLSIMFDKITFDPGNSVWMKSFSNKSLFRMIPDESLILLFVPICKTTFVGERFKYGCRNFFCYL